MDALLLFGTGIASFSTDFALDFALAGGWTCGTPVSSFFGFGLLLALGAGISSLSSALALDCDRAGGLRCGTTVSGSLLLALLLGAAF